MFRNYEQAMQNLKALSETLISEAIQDSRFLISLDTAVRYIQGAWESFPLEYQRVVENDYVTDVVDKMTMVIKQYLQEVSSVPNALDNFQSGCNVVGNHITLYSNKANMQNSAPNPPPSPSNEDTREYVYTDPEPPQEELIPIEPLPEAEQPSEMPERSFPFDEFSPPPPPQNPPKKKQSKQPHKKKEKTVREPVPSPQPREEHSPTLQAYFFSDSEKKAPEMERKFAEFKKCVILIEFINEEGEKICSYGLRRGLELGKTEIIPDETTKSRNGFRKVYGRYFFTYHFHVRFNEKNFIEMPSLNGDISDEIPLSHLNYGRRENTGSLIEISFVPQKDGFQVKCMVENERKERADFLSELLNHFDRTEPVGMRSGSGEYDNIVKYQQNGGVWCQYELEPKQEDRNSPDIKTEIMIYLEF